MKIFYTISKQILFMSLLSACGEAPYIEPEVKPYVDRFVAEAQLRGVVLDVSGLTVRFVDQLVLTNKGFQFGYCEDGTVTIVKPYFLAQLDVNREVVLFHELGHCVLNRTHVDGLTQLSIPESLMIIDPTLLTSYYETNRNFYLNEVFSYETNFIAK
jgi:hypothetical protein